MPRQVTVYDQDGEVGTILHTDDNEFHLTGNTELLDRLMHAPVFVQDEASGLVDVYATDDPDAFMTNLHRHYKSVGLRASEALEV